jgi:8-amino-7-oxononanoate synthase
MGLEEELSRRLTATRAQGLYRRLRRVNSSPSPRLELGDGSILLNFSSNDYLGLAGHPTLREAAQRAIQRYGTGSSASRLICGSLAPHHELEEALAAFKGTEAALTFTSGYAAALGTISALVSRGDIIVIDKRAHACLVDAARLCGARLRVFAHNDLRNLEEILQWATTASRAITTGTTGSPPRILVVTESLFSMDGDTAPLRELVALKQRYRAWLMVDEAHATGLYGSGRRGLAEAAGVSADIEVQMGTLGKAFAAAGGYVCGSRALIDYLINTARTFIFSTAPVPAAAAAALAALQLVQSAEGESRCSRLWERVSQLREHLFACGWSLPAASPILPLILGGEAHALAVADALGTQGIFVPAIRYPTVARGQARLRVTLSAAHASAEVERLATALRPYSPTACPTEAAATALAKRLT